MDKKRKRRRKKNAQAVLILILLLLVAAASLWIIHRSRTISASNKQEAEQIAEEQTAEEQAAAEAQAAEEEAAAKAQAEEMAVTSHVYSHRGSAGPKEHTFEAYDAAIEAGSRYIEQDVVISSDGVLFVSHDLNAVERTDYNGMYEYIDSETIDTIRTDAGDPILRLSDVFDRYGRDVMYVIELKTEEGAYDDIVQAFEELVDKYGYSDNIIISSFYPEPLRMLEDKYPDMPKMLLCWNQGDFDRYYDEPYVDILSLSYDAVIMTESNCRQAHDAGKLFSAWTLNDEDAIKEAIDMGVDTYFTDNTELALSIEKDYGRKVRGVDSAVGVASDAEEDDDTADDAEEDADSEE